MVSKSTNLKVTLKISSFILRLLLNIAFYVLVAVLIIIVSREAFKFTYQIYGPDTVDQAPGREIVFEIKKGEATMDVASRLELNRAIENKYSFYVKTKLQNLSIMPGTYKISSSMTYDQILDVITNYKESIVQTEDPDAGKETEAGQAAGEDKEATETDQSETGAVDQEAAEDGIQDSEQDTE